MNRNLCTEDKKCRLCGRADTENEHIFEARDRNLVKKIAAVFSIWVTFHDPLPKFICPKCHTKVLSSYKNFCQVKKLQAKWIENVESLDPDNNYVQVLNFIERSNFAIKNFIQTNYGNRLPKDAIENLLIGALSDVHESSTSTLINTKPKDANNETSTNGDVAHNDIGIGKQENEDNNVDENLGLAEMSANKKIKLSPTPTLAIKCKCCPLKFESLKQLALHQVTHLKLNMPKLFQAKCLSKNFRRGRLISVQSRQSIRCLNCYLVFDDNKCILEHWSKAECDFYCQICGEEFAQSPKLLREHITDVHGISYRSLKMQRDLAYLNSTATTLMFTKTKQKIDVKATFSMQPKLIISRFDPNQPTNMEVSSSTTQFHIQPPSIKCRICNRDFRNFKACNSHMRAHKPPYAYNDTELLPDMNTDAYMEPEPIGYGVPATPPFIIQQPSTNNNFATAINSPLLTTTTTSFPYDNNIVDFNNIIPKKLEENMQLERPQINLSVNNNDVAGIINNSNNSPLMQQVLSSQQQNTHQTTTKVPTSTAPRGIRMKFVSRRSDLNGINSAIKVKSLNDLQTNQNVQNMPTQNTQHASAIVNNLEQPPPIQNYNTSVPQTNQIPQTPTLVKNEPIDYN